MRILVQSEAEARTKNLLLCTEQAQVTKYAVENGNQAAIRRYSKEFSIEIKESTLSTWKSKYLAEIERRHKEGLCATSGEIVVSSLPSKKRGRPLLLGEILDKQVQCYICATRDAGGTITTTVVLAAGEAIVRNSNKKFAYDNGGPIAIKLTKHWARSWLSRMNFVKRKGTTSAKMEASQFDNLKEQFLLDTQELTLFLGHNGPWSPWVLKELKSLALVINVK